MVAKKDSTWFARSVNKTTQAAAPPAVVQDVSAPDPLPPPPITLRVHKERDAMVAEARALEARIAELEAKIQEADRHLAWIARHKEAESMLAWLLEHSEPVSVLPSVGFSLTDVRNVSASPAQPIGDAFKK